MTAYYNEIDPFAAQWLRNLIARNLIALGDVDERSIVDVQPDDLRGYTQCHFFAGIGGWSYALRLAGWPDDKPVWTGSCPCQPFSGAGKKLGFFDSRHLWPIWKYLIEECEPSIVFGEQVAGTLGGKWTDTVKVDFESIGFSFGSGILQAGSFGSPQERERNYFVAESILAEPRRGIKNGSWCTGYIEIPKPWNSNHQDFEQQINRYVLLADGISSYMAKRCAGGFGNAIVPQVAAEFIAAFMETQ